MGTLEDYVDKVSNFVTLADGETKTFTIIGYQQTLNSLSGKPTMAYTIKLEDSDSKKIFQTASVKFARTIMALPNQGKGCVVEVKRKGVKFDTTYKVELIKAPEIELPKDTDAHLQDSSGDMV